jgi:sugar transferase (PEP-CTERM/EpsH1 system associated)
MRVLYLCHRIPYPPNKGDKIRAFHQLRAIAADHEVDVFTLADDAKDLSYRAELAPYSREMTVVRLNSQLARLLALPFLVTRTPLTFPYFYSAELAVQVRKAILKRSYDRIVVYCSAMFQYIDWVDHIPIITDLVDVDSDKWIQYASHARFPFSAVYRREGYCLEEYERKICQRSSSIVVTTEREAELVRKISNLSNVHVIANGVETDYFDPLRVARNVTGPTLLFVGDMSYFPNQKAVLYFAQDVLPLIQKVLPDVRFLVVGRNPSRAVQQLQRMKGVQVTGFVDDVRTYLAQATVSVAPFSIAAGIQNKILEAMSYGLPVVATPRAVQGLSADVRAIIDIGQNAQELAAKTLALLSDLEGAHRKGMEGRERVTRDYNWSRSLNQLLQLLEMPRGNSTSRTSAHFIHSQS